MRILSRLGILAACLLLCASLSSCASGPAHLDPSDVQKLASMPPVAVVYVDPATPLAADLSASGGGELGALKMLHQFEPRLEPYQARAQALGVADREYTAVHAALSSIPWLKDATWTRTRKTEAEFNEFNFQLATSEKAVGRVVIVIEADVSMQSYVDAMHTHVYMDLYTKKLATSTERPARFTSQRFDGGQALGNSGPELGSNGRPLPDAELKARLDALFDGDSAPFLRGLDGALVSLKTQLTGYFSGSDGASGVAH